VSSTSFSIQVNGELFGFFKGKRGLRQGVPISPFLFVLCLEYFSRLLNIATSHHPFNYHPKCQVLRITHLAFANDLLLFARGDVASIGVLWESVLEFGEVSGLKANTMKSNLRE
jgi:hypothetical protein